MITKRDVAAFLLGIFVYLVTADWYEARRQQSLTNLRLSYIEGFLQQTYATR